jgi:hypothetical protein
MKLVEAVKLLTCTREVLIWILGWETDYTHFNHETLSLGLKRPARQAEYSPPSSVEVEYNTRDHPIIRRNKAKFLAEPLKKTTRKNNEK